MALASVVRMFFSKSVKKRKMLLNYEIMRVCSLEKGIYVWTIGIDDSKRFGEPNFSEASMMVDSVDFLERLQFANCKGCGVGLARSGCGNEKRAALARICNLQKIFNEGALH